MQSHTKSHTHTHTQLLFTKQKW